MQTVINVIKELIQLYNSPLQWVTVCQLGGGDFKCLIRFAVTNVFMVVPLWFTLASFVSSLTLGSL